VVYTGCRRSQSACVIKTTSKASVDSPIARRRWQAEIEEGLAASAIPHTLLRSNAYMQNVLTLAPASAATSSFGSAAGKGGRWARDMGLTLIGGRRIRIALWL
jgi:uncharacterized protein YbjT (DUF2867 family)